MTAWDGRIDTWRDWAREHGCLPWQMTRKAWARQFDATEPVCVALLPDWRLHSAEDDRLFRKATHLARHKREVLDAMAAGEPVGLNVILEYGYMA